MTSNIRTINSDLAREIEERKRIEQVLQEMAITDPLTGLFNRRYFFQTALSELAHAARDHNHIAVMMLDIDFFKHINDTHGHKVGDLTLQHFVNGLRSCIRQTDMLARFGGDEFTILMPETNGAQAMQIAERIHQFIRNNPVPNIDIHVTCTTSIGIASLATQQVNISLYEFMLG